MHNLVPVVVACICLAHAGNAEILSPNQGEPALVLRGGEFSVRATEKSDLALVSGDLRVPLEGTWSRGDTQCIVRAPENVLPGKYAIECGGATNHNAVFVYDEFPRRYTIVCVPAVALSDEGALQETIHRINASGAALAIFLGTLSKSGAKEELERAAEALRGCAVPTLVTPGPSDIAGGGYERYFGDGWHGTRFGEDAYLSLNSADLVPMDELGQGPAEIQRFRRMNRAARWTVAFTNRLSTLTSTRILLTLFVDDPADFVLSNDGLLRRKGFDPIPIGVAPAALPETETGILLVEIGEAGPILVEAATQEDK